MISTAYTGDPLGGVIERNLLDSGYFERYPSILASADRYSAIALMQFYFSWALLTAKAPISRWTYLWMAFNIACSVIALGIAGARSRILIVLVVIVSIVLSQGLQAFSLSRASKGSRVNRVMLACIAAFALSAGVVLIYLWETEAFPVLEFLQQTFREGDVQTRVSEALQFSLIPEDVSLLGNGLGTVGTAGRPGEFGIQSMWAESGLVWGGLLLANFLGLLYVVTVCAAKSGIRGQITELVMRVVPALLLVFGLLAGLTSVFELSTGILMACGIAVSVRRPFLDRQLVRSIGGDTKLRGSSNTANRLQNVPSTG
jgi:hypothetical protein